MCNAISWLCQTATSVHTLWKTLRHANKGVSVLATCTFFTGTHHAKAWLGISVLKLALKYTGSNFFHIIFDYCEDPLSPEYFPHNQRIKSYCRDSHTK